MPIVQPNRWQQIVFRAVVGFVAVLMATIGGALAANTANPNLSWNTLWPALIAAAILAFEKWWATEGNALAQQLIAQLFAQLNQPAAAPLQVAPSPSPTALAPPVDFVSSPLLAAAPAVSPITVNVHTTPAPPAPSPSSATSSAVATPSLNGADGDRASAVAPFGGDIVPVTPPTGG